MLMKHGLKIIKYLALVKLVYTAILGTAYYLYRVHRNRESYALNIFLTAFVTRITGVEFLQAVLHRLSRMKFHLTRVFYKSTFVNKPLDEDSQNSFDCDNEPIQVNNQD